MPPAASNFGQDITNTANNDDLNRTQLQNIERMGGTLMIPRVAGRGVIKVVKRCDDAKENNELGKRCEQVHFPIFFSTCQIAPNDKLSMAHLLIVVNLFLRSQCDVICVATIFFVNYLLTCSVLIFFPRNSACHNCMWSNMVALWGKQIRIETYNNCCGLPFLDLLFN